MAPQRLTDEPSARAGHAHAGHGGRGHDGEELVEEAAGGFARAALDALIARGQHEALAGRHGAGRGVVEQRGSLGHGAFQEVAFEWLADERGLEADAADVYAQKRHIGVCSDLPWDSYESPV